jgi:hypothetical protein
MRWHGRFLLAVLLVGWLTLTVTGDEPPVAAAGRATVTVVGEPAAEELPAWKQAILKKLTAKISVQFSARPLWQALTYFREKGGINIILNSVAPGVDPDTPIVLTLDNVALGRAICWTARLAGLVYIVKDEAVFVTTTTDLSREWLEEIRDREAQLDRVAEETWMPEVNAKLQDPTSFQFENTPLAEAMSFLASLHRLNIVLEPAYARPDNTVTMAVDDMTVGHALRWMLRLKGLDYTLIDEAVFVSTPARIRALQASRRGTGMDRRLRVRVNVTFQNVPLAEALEALKTATGLNIALRADSLPEVTVSITCEHMPLERVVHDIMSQTGLSFAFTFEEDALVIWVQKPPTRPGPGEAPPRPGSVEPDPEDEKE